MKEHTLDILTAALIKYGTRVFWAAVIVFVGLRIIRIARRAAGQIMDRAGVEIIAQQEGSDPAAVIYDAVAAAKSRQADVLICDTAGRLHNKKNLMEELRKINRIIDKEYPDAYRETLVVLDGTTGQNAMAQAKPTSPWQPTSAPEIDALNLTMFPISPAVANARKIRISLKSRLFCR